MSHEFSLPMLAMDDNNISIFSEERYGSEDRDGLELTDQLVADSVRLRRSVPGFASDWHVAADPALITVQQGTLRVILQNGDYMDFSAGQSFVARDILPEGVAFDPSIHGHRSEVAGNEDVFAVHIKLK